MPNYSLRGLGSCTFCSTKLIFFLLLECAKCAKSKQTLSQSNLKFLKLDCYTTATFPDIRECGGGYNGK